MSVQETKSKTTVVIGHFDVHGVITAALAARKLNAFDVFAKYPETGPETLIQFLQNNYAAAPTSLRIVIVDIPVNLKAPKSFVDGLEELTLKHEVEWYDHHETSLQYINMFKNVKAIYVGPSAYDLTKLFVSEGIDEMLCRIAAIGDRDPEIIRRGLFDVYLHELADGFDVMVRRDALRTVKLLVENPEKAIEEARTLTNQIPCAEVERQIGPVVIAQGLLPEQWGPKSLEKLCFMVNSWYGVGVSYDSRNKQYVVRSIIRWDIAAKYNLPSPINILKRLYPTRSIIGHPAAPTISAATREEAFEMRNRVAEELARQAPSAFSKPGISHLINIESVGDLLSEVLLSLKQILENQQRMYKEYLDLKRKQVELLERVREHRAD